MCALEIKREEERLKTLLGVLRICVGLFFVSMGLDKIEWLHDAQPLIEDLNRFLRRSSGIQSWYLEHVAIPYAAVWARLIFLGETLIGISLLLGLLTQLSSGVGIFMVGNFHLANGRIPTPSFFQDAYAIVLLACLTVILLSRAGRCAGIDSLLARKVPKGILW
jgi:uncharacterized membrane protein YphA (DoxX/SURF4 family)